MSINSAYGGFRNRNRKRFSSYGELETSGGVTNHLIWPNGPDLNVPDQTTGVQMTFESTSANDDKDAGTGARGIEIHYLDVNLNQREELILLEGITPVLTTATDIRFINEMHIQTYGSLKQTAGVVTAKNAGITFGHIAANKIRNSSSARMVPKDYHLRISAMYGGSVSGTSAAKAIVRFFATVLEGHDHTEAGLMIPYAAVGSQDTSLSINSIPTFPFGEGLIVGFQCDTDKAAIITAGFFGELERI